MTAPALNAVVQGQGSVSADNLNTYEQTTDLVTDLRGFIGLPGIQVAVRGQVTVGDGNGGFFYWNASSTSPDNGSSIIVPNGAALGAWIRLPLNLNSLSTRQVLTGGTAVTYTTPPNALQIRVRMWGAGGGGGGSAVAANDSAAGSVGGDTIFNSVHAGGGNPSNGAGGSSSTGVASVRQQGAAGTAGSASVTTATNMIGIGGAGGGLGGGKLSTTTGNAGAANTGGGGGSAGFASAAFAVNDTRGGAGGGEYVELLISGPSSTYTYTIGAGGAAGAAGTSGHPGGAGGSGLIVVDEYYG